MRFYQKPPGTVTVMGRVPPDLGPEWGLCYALMCKADETKGFAVGNFVYHNDYMCEITEVKGDRIHLVGLGWKLITECSLTKPSV